MSVEGDDDSELRDLVILFITLKGFITYFQVFFQPITNIDSSNIEFYP